MRSLINNQPLDHMPTCTKHQVLLQGEPCPYCEAETQEFRQKVKEDLVKTRVIVEDKPKVVKNKQTEENRQFWNHVESVATKVRARAQNETIPVIGKTKLTQEQLREMAPTKATFCVDCGTKTTPHFLENEYHEQAWRLYCLNCGTEMSPTSIGSDFSLYIAYRKK